MITCAARRFLHPDHRRSSRAWRASEPLLSLALARALDRFAFLLLMLAMRAYLGPLRAAVRGSHDLRRRHLHRRARHADRHAGRLRGACSRRGDRRRQRGVDATRALAGRGGRSGRGLLCRLSSIVGWYVEQLHRQAERAGPRAALHRPQHRDDAAGLRPRPHRAARVSRRDERRGRRSGEQSGHAPEHPPVGLARAAGHAAPDSGDPHLLRLSRHRHRSLPDRRHDCAR